MNQPKEEGRRSLFYFNSIAEFENPAAYEKEVRSKTEWELEGEIASQAWEVAKVAADKHWWARFAYVCVILFLVCWAVARLGLSFVA